MSVDGLGGNLMVEREPSAKLGVIGGSGLYDLPDLQVIEQVDIDTPFGRPSDEIIVGSLHGQEIVFLPRHGRGHRVSPSDLPYQANIYAMKALGVTHLLSVSAVGSLREDLPPLSLLVPDQIIDRTVIRPRTFFGSGLVAHVGIADPYCPVFRQSIVDATKTTDRPAAPAGTYICIEGPQFSTRAESNLFRSWGASIIGMTAMPEARLAREAELCYAALALVTDYDVWHDEFESVTVDMVVANLHKNVVSAQATIAALAKASLPTRTCACGDALGPALSTARDAIPTDIRDHLGIIVDRYLGPAPAGDAG